MDQKMHLISGFCCLHQLQKEGAARRRRRGRRKEGETLMYLGFYGDLTASCLVIKVTLKVAEESTQSDQTTGQIRHPARRVKIIYTILR